jgi:hypothetical protein
MDRLSLASSVETSRRSSLNQMDLGDGDHSVEAFMFDHTSGEGAFELAHHLLHKDKDSLKRYYSGDVQAVNIRIDAQNSEWFVAYSVGKSVIFR